MKFVQVGLRSLAVLLAVVGLPAGARESVDLSGTWRFRLDADDLGESQRWFTQPLPDTVRLPGSLQPGKHFVGAAWYQHEIGPFRVWPDLGEVAQYTGLLKARNDELFGERLATSGMDAQARDFLMASGTLQALCYKEEIESMLFKTNKKSP